MKVIAHGKKHCSRCDLFMIFKEIDFANYVNDNTHFGSEETPFLSTAWLPHSQFGSSQCR